jgi:hypothetical protein
MQRGRDERANIEATGQEYECVRLAFGPQPEPVMCGRLDHKQCIVAGIICRCSGYAAA